MKDVIKRIEKFSFYNNYAIESHLENMALKGYRLISIDKSVWTYKVITPTSIKYRVTYFEDQSLIFYDNPYTKRTEEDFFMYCRNVGWVLAGQWGQMQIFYTGTDEFREIETDYTKELVALKSIMRKKALPSVTALSSLAIIQGGYQLIQYNNNPIKSIASTVFILTTFIWILLFLAGFCGVSGYLSWGKKAGVSIKKYNRYPQGSDTRYQSSLGFIGIGIIVMMAQALILAFRFSDAFAYFFVAQIVIVFILSRRLRVRRAVDDEETTETLQRDTNLNKFMVRWVVVSFLLVFGANGIINLYWLGGDEAPATHSIEFSGVTLVYDLLNDDIPLKIDDLLSIDNSNYIYELKSDDSIFVEYTRANQYSYDISALALSYEIVEFKNKLFYSTCLDYYLKPYISSDSLYDIHQTNDPVWEATQVYQVFDNATPIGVYIVCYDDMIVYLDSFAPLTSQQAEIASEKFMLK